MDDKTIYYVAGVIEKNILVGVLVQPTKLRLKWADGMIGVMPVFDNIEDAIAYGGENCPIIPISSKNNEEE